MKNQNSLRLSFVFLLFCGLLLLSPGKVFGHCDGMDGPVVRAAQKALESGNVNMVLIWAQKDQEGEIRRAFEQALAIRKLGAQAKELADRYFFETLVRVHRAGEGAHYTGLKPAGRDLGPAIPAADRALEQDAVVPLAKLLTESVEAGLREQFKRARAKKNFDANDVAAGREFVKAYVELIHLAQGIYQATKPPVHSHLEESTEAVGRAPRAPAHE